MPAAYAGTVPADANPDVSRIFEALLELRWREVPFPYTELTTELRQDLAIHKFADRDGAHIEGTGRSPLQITARVPLLVGIEAGPNEHWQRPLYPFTWRKLFEACADRRTGTLQHPELGELTCKLESMRTRWDANVRSGVYVDISWMESDDLGINLEQDLAQPSPLADVQAAAGDLDNYVLSLRPDQAPTFPQSFSDLQQGQPTGAPQIPPKLPYTFSDLVHAIRGSIDQGTLLQRQFAGRIDNLLYQVQTILDSLQSPTNRSALNWPFIDAGERARAACYDLKRTLLAKGRPVGFYTVPRDATLAMIAANIPATISDVITLNPAYMSSPLITGGSVVRYYTKPA